MKNSFFIILLLFLLFLASPCVYSQHIASVIEVEIPLNSTKEYAHQKLVNYQFVLSCSDESAGYKVLYYKHKYSDKRVGLWMKSGQVSIIEWVLDLSARDGIEMELRDVKDVKPYAESKIIHDYSWGAPEYYCEDYYYWNGYTLVLGGSFSTLRENMVKFTKTLENGCTLFLGGSLFIMSNTDASIRYKEARSLMEKQKKAQEEEEAKKKEKEERELQEQRRREQEQLEIMRQAEAKRKREADSIAHIQELKENYSSCRFLFASEESFISCITQDNQNTIENEIKTLIDQKMTAISNDIVKGTEFKNQYYARIIMEGICDIPNYMSDVSPAIANYAEDKILAFVAERKTLNKAYNKAKKKDPNLKSPEFLISYINDNEKGYTENTSSEPFVMANIAYSIAPQTSFGVTFGSVKKFGFYAGFNGNIRGFTNLATGFKMDAAEYECDQTGTISTLTTEYSYSGDKATSRLGATAGLVYKINDPLSVYIGGGYGYRNVLWKLDSGQWVKCIDDSYRGIAIDAGLVYNIGQLNLSLGVQTIGVKYLEAKIGIGCSFKTLKTR